MADKKPNDVSGDMGTPPDLVLADTSGTTAIRWLAKQDPGAAKAWLEHNWSALAPDAKALFKKADDEGYFGYKGLPEDGGRFSTFIAAHVSDIGSGKANEVDLSALADAAKTRVAAATAGHATSENLGISGSNSALDAAAIDTATTARANADAAGSGLAPTGDAKAAVKASQAAGHGIPSRGGLPDWVSQAYGGGIPNRAQTSVLIDDWNNTHPGDKVSDATALWQKITVKSPDGVELIDAAISGKEPIVQQIYKVGAAGDPSTTGVTSSGAQLRNVPVDAATVKMASEKWGLDSTTLGQVIRSANAAGLMTPDGQELGWQPLASLYKMSQSTHINSPTAPDSVLHSSRQGSLSPSSPAFPATQDATNNPDGLGSRQGSLVPGGAAVDSRASQLARLAILYKTGMDMYHGDSTLAALYASGNKVLVDRLTTASYGQLDATDANQAQQILLHGGWDPKLLQQAGYATSSPWFDNIFQGSANAYGGLGNIRLESNAAHAAALARETAAKQNYITTNKADPAAVQQQVVDMWQQLFDAKPTAQQIAIVSGKIDALVQSRAAAAGLQNQNTTNVATDVGAEVRSAAEASPDYQKFYGNRPLGMSDADYHNQFKGAAQSMLGSQAADPQAVRSGMATGDYQTTVGQVAGTASSFNNSTFMNRLARAAIAVNGAT